MIRVGLYTIEINDDSITSDLSDFMPWEMAYALETLIITHYIAGIDVTSNAYQEGILNAVNSLQNNLKSCIIKNNRK